MVSRYSSVIILSMMTVLVLIPVFGADPQDKPDDSGQQVSKQNIILISKETTHITEPLDDEGYVDYVEAINDLCSEGVTPENNFEVVLRTVLPPNEIPESMRKKYFSRIGIPVPEPDARFYQDFITFTLTGNNDPALRQQTFDELDVIMSEPWTNAQHPRAAKWVASFGKDLDKLAEGSKRIKYYTPYLTGEEPDDEPFPRVLAILLGSAQQQREVARGLSIRAMGRIGAGNLDGAWSDVQAMHRVSRHVAEGFTLIESLVGIAIDAMAFHAEILILNSPQLTAEQNKRFLADLKALKPLPRMADKLDVGERFMGLDVVTTLARQHKKHGLLKMLKIINDLSDATGQSPLTFYVAAREDPALQVDPAIGLIDWNMTLLTMNQWYDRIVAAAREPDFEQRKALFAVLDRDLKQLAAEMKASQFQLTGPRKAKGRALGKLLVSLLLPACQAVRVAEDRNAAQREVIQLAYALELSRRENGKVPGSLRSLIPKYVSAIPADPLSGRPLHYQPGKDGFLVYSVGRNGVDDEGRTHNDGGGDDIAVRVGE